MYRLAFARTHEDGERLKTALLAANRSWNKIIVREGKTFGQIPFSSLPRFSTGDEIAVLSLDDLANSLAEVVQTFDRGRKWQLTFYVAELDLGAGDAEFVGVMRGIRAAAALQERFSIRNWERDIQRARSRGAFGTGRPTKVKVSSVADLRAQGMGVVEIARRLAVSRWTVYRKLRELDRQS